MNDRMQIAAMVMQGMLANSRMGVLEPWQYAEDAINCADALLKALAESEAEQAPNWHDDVAAWRQYMTSKEATKRVAAGLTNYVDDAFTWKDTPQGFEFWKRLAYDKATDADKARARDFARRVLKAMEASDE